MIFPGIQGGPLMHVIAAKAMAFKEALQPEFKTYQQGVKRNAKAMAATLTERGLRIVSGGTDSHVFLVDLRAKKITGKAAEALLGRAHMTVNKNAIPNDPEKPFRHQRHPHRHTGAHHTRLRRRAEARFVSHCIADVLEAGDDARRHPTRGRRDQRAVRPLPGLRLNPFFTPSFQGATPWLVATVCSSPVPPTCPTACCAPWSCRWKTIAAPSSRS